MNPWQHCTVAADGTHHLRAGQALYPQRFFWVLKFHDPGLAAVGDLSGAYHIDVLGQPAYPARFRRTFGFYEGLAAVIAKDGNWLHIRPDGTPLNTTRYGFCGNFQESRCVVREKDGSSFHITSAGLPAYAERYRYAGDYRDECAVVQRADGLHSHIDRDGQLVHGHWFIDLDVFHKGLARARDDRGWHHIDQTGAAIYGARFSMVEPFYNGIARVETNDGALLLITEEGHTQQQLRPARQSALAVVSSDLVGFWRTQTLWAAVELGVFDALPGSIDVVAQRCQVPVERLRRLARALEELGLLAHSGDTMTATPRGVLLRANHPLSLAPAAQLWAGDHYQAWTQLPSCLRDGVSASQRLYSMGWFQHIAEDAPALHGYHAALSSYARHDYAALPKILNLTAHRQIIDAGGGSGALLVSLLQAAPTLRGVLIERPEVCRLFQAPADVAVRCQAVPADLFLPWPVQGDAVILARVLHDFADEDAGRLLEHARRALPALGRLYIVEMLLPEQGGAGGLLDLNMLVMTGGRERTLAEFQSLLNRTGFAFHSVLPLQAVSSVLVAEAR